MTDPVVAEMLTAHPDVLDDVPFGELLDCAREIVLPGATGVRVPQQRRGGGWYDVTSEAVVLTEELPAYGSC